MKTERKLVLAHFEVDAARFYPTDVWKNAIQLAQLDEVDGFILYVHGNTTDIAPITNAYQAALELDSGFLIHTPLEHPFVSQLPTLANITLVQLRAYGDQLTLSGSLPCAIIARSPGGGDGIYSQQWAGIISKRGAIDIVHILTWNDYQHSCHANPTLTSLAREFKTNRSPATGMQLMEHFILGSRLDEQNITSNGFDEPLPKGTDTGVAGMSGGLTSAPLASRQAFQSEIDGLWADIDDVYQGGPIPYVQPQPQLNTSSPPHSQPWDAASSIHLYPQYTHIPQPDNPESLGTRTPSPPRGRHPEHTPPGITSSPFPYHHTTVTSEQYHDFRSPHSLSTPIFNSLLQSERAHATSTRYDSNEGLAATPTQLDDNGSPRPEFYGKPWASCRCPHPKGLPQRMDHHWATCPHNPEPDEFPCGRGACTKTFGRNSNRKRHWETCKGILSDATSLHSTS
ncbi:hypothetical protein FRB93_002531 [Tulasnella sp. JGI-2019a]|nr:hypothetical protein FRB93_002531 [Tulasnella sp. JGI-2019a]